MKKYFFILLSLTFLSSCAFFKEKGGKAEIATPTSEMMAAFNAAERFYFAKRYEDAIFSYESYIRNHPYNTLTAKASYRLGEIALGQGRLNDAIGYYRKAVSKRGQADWVPDAFYKQAVALHKGGHYSDIYKVLDRIPYEELGQRLAIRVGSLRVSAARKEGGKEIEAMKGFFELYDAYEKSSEGEAELSWLVSRAETTEEIRNFVKLEELPAGPWPSLVRRFEGHPSGAFLLWKLGNSFYAKGDYKKAGLYLDKFLTGYPKSEFVPEAKELYAEVEKRGGGREKGEAGETKERVESGISIGVLLPLTGKYGVYGESVLHGLECAAGVYDPCSTDFNVNLVIRDTQGNPRVAAEEMNELVSDPKVVGIVGPLPQVEVDAVVPIAEEAKVPMIALSQREDVPRLGSMVFRNFLTVRDQVATVVHYACRTKHWKNLAILYPKNPAGNEFLENFVEEVKACGGKVVAKQSYAAGGPESMTEAVNALKGKGSFQALFIPDVYRKIVEIVPSIEFADLPDVVLLGGAGWNHPDLLRGGGRLEGSVYVDGFFTDSSALGVRDFVEKIRSAYGVAPTLLEAYAYDTLRLMGTTIEQRDAKSRAALHEALSRVKNFNGVTGNISFDDEGDARRKLFLLQVSGGQVKEID